MGLLSAKTFRQIATGAGTRALYKIQEAKELGDKGLENLSVAKKEVNEEVKKLTENYNEALTVGSAVGGGAFANYMFQQMGAEKLGGLNNLLPSQKEEEIRAMRVSFDSLDSEVKKQFEESPYKTTVSEAYKTEAKNTVENGLVEYNNLGKGTSNFLLNGLTGGIQRQVREEKERIISGVTTPELKDVPVTRGATFYSPTLTPINVINNNSVYEKMLVELPEEGTGQPSGQFGIGTPNTNPYYQTVDKIDAQAKTMIEYGFTGPISEARAYIIEQMNNPQYNHPNLKYMTTASDNAPIINSAYTVFSNALVNGDTETMNEGILELKKAGRNSEAEELQEQYDDFIAKQKQQFESKKAEQELIQQRLEESETAIPSEDEGLFPSISKPRFRSEGPLTYEQWSNLTPDAVKEIYKVGSGISTEGLSEEDKALAEKINTALGLS